MTHIVLGGNGVAGRETIRALGDRGVAAISLGRTPSPDPDTDSVIADLVDPRATEDALRGASVAYLTAGLPYSDRVWESNWRKMLANTISACLVNDTMLVYLDNPYAYGHVRGRMTEQTKISPASRMGQVRGDALAILGTDPRARGQTWHLPTASPALTGEQYMNIATARTGRQHTISALTMRIGALFNQSAAATIEMAYQYTDPYQFDSTNFETIFG